MVLGRNPVPLLVHSALYNKKSIGKGFRGKASTIHENLPVYEGGEMQLSGPGGGPEEGES